MSSRIAVLEGRFLAKYGELLARTCRVEVQGWENAADILQGETPFIFSAWHGQTHLLFPFIGKKLDTSQLAMIVVADHRQEVLTAFARAINAHTYPISMQDTSFTAARNLMSLLKALRSGKFSYITPDGPDGPARVPKEGIGFLATRLEAWVIPIGAFTRTSLHIPRWDRYALPLPFSRIRVDIKEPIRASRAMDRQQLLSLISQRLSAAQDDAQKSW